MLVYFYQFFRHVISTNYLTSVHWFLESTLNACYNFIEEEFFLQDLTVWPERRVRRLLHGGQQPSDVSVLEVGT
jgi:hypothetical protein